MAPSTVHELALLWLRDDPSQLAALLALTHHAPCPVDVVVEDSALRAAFPVEVTPDLVLRDPGTGRWLLVEVQRRPDEAKARRWPLAMAALSLGGDVRVGLEDNFYLPDGTMATSNGALVAAAAQLVALSGRQVATVDEARALLWPNGGSN